MSAPILRALDDNKDEQDVSTLVPTKQTVLIGYSANLFIQDDPLISYFIVGALSTTPPLKLFNQSLGISGDAFTIASLAYANTSYFNNFHNILDHSGNSHASFLVPPLGFLQGLNCYFVGLTWNPARAQWLHITNVAEVLIR